MPVPTETLYNTRKVSLWFAISSVALLASLIWLIKTDYARPWREIQNEYTELQAELARLELMTFETESSQNRLEAAKARVAAEKEALASQQKQVETLLVQMGEGLEADPKSYAGKVLELVTGPMSSEFVEQARQVDLEFSTLIQGQIETPNSETLASQIQPDSPHAEHLKDLLQWFHLESLREREMAIRGAYEEANILQKNLKSEIGPAKVHYEHALALHGAEDEETIALEEELGHLKESFAEARTKYDELADLRKAIEQRIKDLRDGVDSAERDLASIEKEFADAEKKYADLSDKIKHGIMNIPLGDFAAPKGVPGRNEVKQVVLPDVRVDLNFVESYQTDRCITCHVAIDNKDFTKENIARKLEDALLAINEKMAREKQPVRFELPVVEGRDDLAQGNVTSGWYTLDPVQQDALFEELVGTINKYQRMNGDKELEFGEPLLAHPNLDLYVANGSAHPMSSMGCTVCHEGNGEETDFVLAAHTPPSHKVREEWKDEYYIKTAGLMPQQNFETAEHHWNRPMLLPKYSEASCTKCHEKATDIVSYNGEPAASTINTGRFLFQQLGCINCHLVEELEGSRKVGPDLAHVGEKLTKGFAHNWIFSPQEYRPSTNMPHYFMQENNDPGSATTGGDSDPVLRTRAEVVGMTEYLFAASTEYNKVVPPSDLWEPMADEDSAATASAAERGRRLFGEVGCLACHSTLSYAPTDPYEGGPGMPLGERWITGDLIRALEDLVLDVKRGELRRLKKSLAGEEGLGEAEIDLTADEYEPLVEKRLAVSLEDDDGGHISFETIADAFNNALDGPDYDVMMARREAFEKILGTSPKKLQAVTLSEDERELVTRTTDDVYDAILDVVYDRFDAMSYIDRVEYAMVNFDSAQDSIFTPDAVNKPIFTRFGPELSSILTKFADRESAVFWLYDWLKDPRHYSSYTKMPRMRLERGDFPVIDPSTGEPTGKTVDADEALDIAVYLSTLADNEDFEVEPFDADEAQASELAAKREELLLELLGALNSEARARAIIADEGNELTRRIEARLTSSFGEVKASEIAAGMDLNRKQWFFLGDKMIGHYGCYSCHSIPGFENASRPGTELTNWGEKQLSQLDFAFFEHAFEEERNKDPLFRNLFPSDRDALIRWARTNPELHVGHTLADFAWHKLRNPRMWDRKKVKAPYEKLKMPNFYLSDDEADALTTYLLSRKPARVNDNLRVDYSNTHEGMVADGRDAAWELNCVSCHQIDGNMPVINQYIEREEGGDFVFDEVNAPPWLRGQGAKVQPEWFYTFLNNVEMLRPWLKVRMPSFHLEHDGTTELVEYFVGLSLEESEWLNEQLKPVEQYIVSAQEKAAADRLAAAGPGRTPAGEGDDEMGGGVEVEQGLGPGWSDWIRQEDLAPHADLLGDYAVQNRLVQPIALDPTETDPAGLAEAYARIVEDAQFLRDLYDVQYPFSEVPPSVESPEAWMEHLADGETMFMTLECLKCHVFGDPNTPGANQNPTAPNLLLTQERLRRGWVKDWLASPARIQPGTKMPNLFGEGDASAFAAFPEEDRENLRVRLFHEQYLGSGPEQMQAITDWIFDAGKKNLDKIQIPLSKIPPADERALDVPLRDDPDTLTGDAASEAVDTEGDEAWADVGESGDGSEDAWPDEESDGAEASEDAWPEEESGDGWPDEKEETSEQERSDEAAEEAVSEDDGWPEEDDDGWPDEE